MSDRLFLPDSAATEALGQRLAAALPADIEGLMLLLRGELGSGKSTLARALLRALGRRGPVPSPTYTLVEPYELDAGTVYHVDLYRIADESELPYLGWDELRNGLMLIEWPERAPSAVSAADLEVALSYPQEIGGLDAGRWAAFRASSRRGAGLLARALPQDSRGIR